MLVVSWFQNMATNNPENTSYCVSVVRKITSPIKMKELTRLEQIGVEKLAMCFK